ncbi:MAG: insulinase family protein, partial [Bacteroidales bacterium]|nr:insulinase family protein [Bacteroidales bacterium]
MITGQTENGLRYAVRKGGFSVGYCALSIRCGTRDEDGYHSGIAHFTEHTLFKGTAHKSAAVVNGYLDRLGGELNAFTTKEEIVLHATVLKEDLPKAAGLLFELATEATFPEKEIETEKGVVIDEIHSYKDCPADEVYDRFEEALYAGHALGRPILGTPASVRRITSDELRRFVRENFTPDRMAFTMMADIDESLMEKEVRRIAAQHLGQSSLMAETETETPPENCATLGNIRGGDPSLLGGGPAKQDVFEGVSPRSEGQVTTAIFDRTVDKRNHEVNAVIGGAAPSLYGGQDRIAAVLLANILGGPASNSILNNVLRERNGWVYGVECGYTQYSDTGVMAISLGCDKDNLEKCFTAISKSIRELQDKPLSDRKLKAAKKQLLGQLAISSESGEAQCLSMGKSLLAFGRVASSDENKAAIEAVTSTDLQ